MLAIVLLKWLKFNLRLHFVDFEGLQVVVRCNPHGIDNVADLRLLCFVDFLGEEEAGCDEHLVLKRSRSIVHT